MEKYTSKLPEALVNDFIKDWYTCFDSLFTKYKQDIGNVKENAILNTMVGESLDNVGKLFNVLRNGLSDESYRKKLKIYYNTYFYTPNLDNFISLINNSLNYYVENIKMGWEYGDEKAIMYTDIVIPIGVTKEYLIDFHKIISAGHKLDYQILQESFTVANKTSLLALTGIISPNVSGDRQLLDSKGRKSCGLSC